MAYKWILYDGAKNQMEIWSTKLDINIVVTTNFYMKESPHSNVVYKCTNHLGFLGCIFKSARWILQLWNHRQPWRETLLRHFITCMHLIKRLKRLLKPSKPLGFSWLQFVFSTLVHTCAQPRKWVPSKSLQSLAEVFTGSFMIGNLDPSLKALAAARFAAGRFFQVKENRPQARVTRFGVQWDWWYTMMYLRNTMSFHSCVKLPQAIGPILLGWNRRGTIFVFTCKWMCRLLRII